jgi:hypothetical protein
MSYCDINEAWPEFIKPQPIEKFTNINTDKKKTENFTNNENQSKIINQIKNEIAQEKFYEQTINENFINEQKNIHKLKYDNCDDYLNHIMTCKSCKNRLYDKFSNNKKPIIDLTMFDKSMRETISVFIFGLILILLLNVFCK